MQTINQQQLVQDFLALTRAKMDDPEAFRGYKTHIPALNKIFGGLHPGWYVVIGGEEKSGKTALALSLLIGLARDGRRILPVSLEMDNMQVGARIFSNLSGVLLSQFLHIDIDEREYQELAEAGEEIKTWDAHFNHGAGTIEEVYDLVCQYNPDVLVVDYAQLMYSKTRKFQNRSQELEYISGFLKREIALNKGCLVIALVQLNTQTVKAKAHASSYGWHGSSAFGKDADVAMTLSPSYDAAGEEIQEERMCNIVASRHSAKDSFRLSFIGARSLMAESTRNAESIDRTLENLNLIDFKTI